MDRILPIAAFLILAAFLGVLVWFVPRLDLGAVVAITLALTGWDFARSIFSRRP